MESKTDWTHQRHDQHRSEWLESQNCLFQQSRTETNKTKYRHSTMKRGKRFRSETPKSELVKITETRKNNCVAVFYKGSTFLLLMTVVLLGKGQWRNTPRWRWTAKGSWHKVLHLKSCVSLTSFTRDVTSPKHLPKHWRFVAWQFGHLGRGLFICNLKLSDLLLRLYSLVTCAV